MSDELSMGEREFNAFRRLILDKSGILLSDNKQALLCARLVKRLRALGLVDFAAQERAAARLLAGAGLEHVSPRRLVSELPLLAQTLDFLSTGQCLTLVFWGAALGVVGSWMGMQRFASWR